MTERPRRIRKEPAPEPWCVIAWIVRLPGHPDPVPLPYNDTVKPLIRRVNRIFKPCHISFKVCKTVVLNAAQLTVAGQSLASLFADDGSITLGDAVRPSVFLQNFMMNGNDAAFTADMREKCLNLFFVQELKYQGATVADRGSGGWFGGDTDRFCYAMVGSSDIGLALNTVAQTVAHEFGHALGLSPPGPQDTHSTDDENLMKASLGDADVKLTADQCATVRAALAHIKQGCP